MEERAAAQLVVDTLGGDHEAYRELVSRYQGHVYGLAYSLVGNWADAQDVAQETFIRAYSNLDQLRDPSRFAAWLRRVAFGVAMNWLRSFRPGLFRQLDGRVDLDRLEVPDFKPGPAEVAEKRELADAVLEAVASLPPKYRVPLTMFHLDGLSYQKVADFLDIPLGTAKSMVHRAREKLRLALAPMVGKEIAPMVQEVFNEHKLPEEFIERLTRKCWETVVLDATGKYVLDEEAEVVNAMTAGIAEFPEWVLQVRDAMPKYGFEMCSHRWLDGLDDAMRMIGAEEHFPSTAGHCGDVPGRIVDAAEQRAAAVQAWIDGKHSDEANLHKQVAQHLGEPTPEKREAAACFVELVRAFFLEPKPKGRAMELAKGWRARADNNETLRVMFEGEGFDRLLQNRCGFKTVDRLDLYIRIIGGRSEAEERHGLCNSQLRFVLRDDPERFEMTRGYLWGLQAYLLGRDAEWLRSSKPECAGAAIHALRAVSQAGAPTPLRRWLVASLLKSTKIWCQCMLNNLAKAKTPANVRDMPDVLDALRG